MSTRRLVESVEGLNSSLALAICGQTRARQHIGAHSH